LSALEALCDYALYKSTFTLHYITLHTFSTELNTVNLDFVSSSLSALTLTYECYQEGS